MSQATATNPPVSVVCTGASPATVTIPTASTSVELVGVLIHNDVVLPQSLTPGCSEGFCWLCFLEPATASVLDSCCHSCLCQICHGSSTDKFCFIELNLLLMFYVLFVMHFTIMFQYG